MRTKRQKIRQFYLHEPREIKAKFVSICSETGFGIAKDELCLYYPKDKKVYSIKSKTYKKFLEAKDDEILGQGQYFN